MKNLSLKSYFVFLSFVVLAACGGGGGGGNSNPPAASVLSGVGAVGTPIVNGNISVVCATGSAFSTTTDGTGAWQFTLSGQTLPCAMELSGGTINGVANTATYTSIATATGTVNISPLADLLVANLVGSASPDTWFAGLSSPSAALAAINQTQVDTALSNLSAMLPALTRLGTNNPITTAFTPTSGNISDDMLTALANAIASNSAGVTYTSLLTNASANTALPADFGTALATAYSGTATGGIATFTALSPTMTSVRVDHAATLLSSGQVLLTGGENSSPPGAPGGTGTTYNTAELYDPVTKTFTALAATLTTPREGHTSTLLSNGQVLLTGGWDNANSVGCFDTAELYNPINNTFTATTGTMTLARCDHAATLLPDGKVLITGVNTAELYDPDTQTFTALAATMSTARNAHTSTLLPNGKVLLAGGGYNTSPTDFTVYDSAELYDPVANTFTAIATTMTSARAFHTATLLPNGKVLLAGGVYGTSSADFSVYDSAELYDPVADTFTSLAAMMTVPRAVHTATQLPSGQILLTGGTSGVAGPVLNTAELYGP